jgi:predicted nucleic acid-binding protein
MGLVIDTSALIAWERSGRAASSSLPMDEEVIVPAIVWAEALIGVRLADSAERAARRRARLEQLRLLIPIESFTPEIAESYADIYAELNKAGGLIPQNDMAVAATARSKQFGVLIGLQDEAHFRRVAGLRLVTLT